MKPGSRILVTGATGFVGQVLCPLLQKAGYEVRAVGRHEIGAIHRGTDWRDALSGCQAVVHLAARVHIMQGAGAEDEDAFREVNLHGTANLAQQAAEAGVQRFVFMSTIKVLGETGVNLGAHSPLAPHGAYAISKAEAEAAVQELGAGYMDSVILRPPLVYGPGVRANFASLIRLVAKGWPLPFGAIDNRRSVIAVGNLADAVRHGLSAQPGIYHPHDARDLSTGDLVRLIAEAMGRGPRLWSVPVELLTLIGFVTGQSGAIARLTETLTTDGAVGDWQPPISTESAIEETVAAFLKANRL